MIIGITGLAEKITEPGAAAPVQESLGINYARNLKCATNSCNFVAIELISFAELADSSAAAVFCCVTASICCKPIVT